MSEDNKEEKKDKIKVLTTLTSKREGILRKRFDTESDKQKEYDQVGKDFDITKKRIQEIEKKALEKFKNSIPPDDVA